LKELAVIVKAYIEKWSAPSQPVGEIEARGAPFIEILAAMRADQFFFYHDLFHFPFSFRKKGL
jgi:hypothetical protein